MDANERKVREQELKEYEQDLAHAEVTLLALQKVPPNMRKDIIAMGLKQERERVITKLCDTFSDKVADAQRDSDLEVPPPGTRRH